MLMVPKSELPVLHAVYRLTHIDERPLPSPLQMNGVDYVITSGRLDFEVGGEHAALMEIDGSVSWTLEGRRLAGSEPETVMMARYHYQRTAPDRVMFPHQANVRSRYTALVLGKVLTLSAETRMDTSSGVRLFGHDPQWRFEAQAGEMPSPTQMEFQSATAVDLPVTRRRWPLNHWVNRLFRRILRWITK